MKAAWDDLRSFDPGSVETASCVPATNKWNGSLLISIRVNMDAVGQMDRSNGDSRESAKIEAFGNSAVAPLRGHSRPSRPGLVVGYFLNRGTSFDAS